MTMLSTTWVWKIVSENVIANVANKHVLTSEQRGALKATRSYNKNTTIQCKTVKLKKITIKKFPNYLSGFIQGG